MHANNVAMVTPVKIMANGLGAGPGMQLRIKDAIRSNACAYELSYEDVLCAAKYVDRPLAV
eukprot:362595-Chlamydomonas_euryale.AAC.4